MKPQDIIFTIVVFFLLFKKNFRLTALVGILLLVGAIPLFAKWIFFTAERFTWYAALCFLIASIQAMYTKKV